jgi:hypothetical protein
MEGKYVVPKDRLVQDEASLKIWLQSKAHTKLIAFIRQCNQAIKGKKVSEASKIPSKIVSARRDFLFFVFFWLIDLRLAEHARQDGEAKGRVPAL